MELGTRNHRTNLRAAYVRLACQFEPTSFVTLATNDTGNIGELTRLLDRFCGMMDRKLIGHKFYRLTPDERSDGIFFIEHTGSNIHAHGMLKFQNPRKLELPLLAAQTWNRLTEAGTTEVLEIHDTARCASYCTKEMRGAVFDSDQVVLVRQFLKG